MHPRVNPKPALWYCDQALGNNKIASTVKRLCTLAGFEGKYTNHSLHTTSASRMYQSEVPKQIIKEITGHCSDCVSTYKRTSDDIRQKASATISGSSNVSEESDGIDKSTKLNQPEPIAKCMSEGEKKHNGESLFACQIIKNAIKPEWR